MEQIYIHKTRLRSYIIIKFILFWNLFYVIKYLNFNESLHNLQQSVVVKNNFKLFDDKFGLSLKKTLPTVV